MRWSHLFVGRKNELDDLKAAYQEAEKGTPRVAAIVAESGFGKTRLVQEFYNWLSTERDGVGDDGYWPDYLERLDENLTVNPEPSKCGTSVSAMPYLWWGIRILDSGKRNTSISSAMWTALSVLNPHLEGHKIASEQKKLQSSVFKESAGTALDIGVDVAGNLASFGLLGIGRTMVSRGKALYDLRQELAELSTRDISPGAVADTAEDELTQNIIEDLRHLSNSTGEKEERTPIVIFIDDVQWLDNDEGTSAFLSSLLETAHKEQWPLLLILTCWEKEWNDSINHSKLPGIAAVESHGDQIHKLNRADGLDDIVKTAFQGLTDSQVDLVLDKADGNPRFLDELLYFLDRSPRHFANRDQSAELSPKGEKAIKAMGFSDLVLDRFDAAPDHVQQALALASLQGMMFSPRLTRLMGQETGFEDSAAGIEESENPFGFVSLSRRAGNDDNSLEQLIGGEFRLRVYMEAALEQLEDHIGLEEALSHFTRSRRILGKDLKNASDTDLWILMEFIAETPSIAFAAAEEMIQRVEEQDPRMAGEIAARFWKQISKYQDEISARSLWAITVTDRAWRGRKTGHQSQLVGLIEKLESKGTLQDADIEKLAVSYGLLSRLEGDIQGAHAALVSGQHAVELWQQCLTKKRDEWVILRLVDAMYFVGLIIAHTKGDKASRPYFVELLNVTRTQYSDSPTPELQKYHANALLSLGMVTGQIEGPEAQRPYMMEFAKIMGELAGKLNTPAARGGYANSLAQIGSLNGQIDGPEAERPYVLEYAKIMGVLAEELKTPAARRDHAIALFRLGMVTGQIDGPEAERPHVLEYAKIMGVLAEELKTPAARRDHAIALFSLGTVTGQIDGPEDERAYLMEYAEIMGALAEELKTPSARKEHANALFRLGMVTGQIDGPEDERPYLNEHATIMGVLAEELRTPAARKDHAIALFRLGIVTGQIDGPEDGRPYLKEYTEIMGTLAEELRTPAARRDHADALAHLGSINGQIEGPEAQRPYVLEYAKIMEALAEELKTPTARRGHAFALYHLGDVTGQIEGPEAQRSYMMDYTKIMGRLAEELKTPAARKDHADALAQLGTVTGQIDGPEAQRSFMMDYAKIMGMLADQLKTPTARKDHAIALYHVGRVTGQIDGPEAQRSYIMEYAKITGALAEQLDTPTARKDYADALAHLGEVTGQIDGPEAQRPYLMEYARIMGTLADELKTPAARRDHAIALHHLGRVTGQIEGPEAQRPYAEKNAEIMGALAEEHKTPIARKGHADALAHLGEVTGQIDGPEAQRPYLMEYARIMGALAEELKTPAARRDHAIALHHLGRVTGQIEGPEAQRPYAEKNAEIMGALAEELKTTIATKEHAIALSNLGDVIGQVGAWEAAASLYLSAIGLITSGSKLPGQLGHHENYVTIVLRSNLMVSKIHAESTLERSFALETLDVRCAGKYAPLFAKIAQELASTYCTVHPKDYSAQRWLGFTHKWHAQCLYSLGNDSEAAAAITKSIESLQRAILDAEVATRALLADVYCLEARIMQRQENPSAADVRFKTALNTLDEIAPRSGYTLNRSIATVCWFHSELLSSLGRHKDSTKIFARGIAAAERYARFKAMDGAAIFRAYKERYAQNS